MKKILFILLFLFIAEIAIAEMSLKEINNLSKKSVVEKTINNAIAILKKELGSTFVKNLRFPVRTSIYEKQCYLAKNILFLEFIKEYKIDLDAQFAEYIYLEENHFEIISNIDKKDNAKKVFEILKEVYRLDASNKYFRLQLAFALVWDQPRIKLHYQMGRMHLKYDIDLENRYNYFKKLYDKNKAKIKYKDLSTRDLTLVVDTPVPVSELEWALKNIRASASSWDKLYKKIKYDMERLERGQYQWPSSNGSYTLENIKENGGICVDQGYYCVVTARAFGIPTLILTGAGQDGFHCWFAFMKRGGRWEFDGGRYASSKFTTGDTVYSQTNKPITDHLVEFYYDRKFRFEKYKIAQEYINISNALNGVIVNGKPNIAIQYAQYAKKIAPLHLEAWKIEENFLIKNEEYSDLLKLLKEKEVYARKYQDLLFDVYFKQLKTLKKLNDTKGIKKILTTIKFKIKRDDLLQKVYLFESKSLSINDNKDDARELLEKVLMKQKSERIKNIDAIQSYIYLIKKDSSQLKEGARFLSNYLKKYMIKRDRTFHANKYFINYLYEVYSLIKDTKEMNNLKKKYPKILAKNSK